MPLYGGRLTARAPRGFLRLVGGVIKWTFDLEGEPVRLAAVQKADPEAYLKLSRQRDSRVRLRTLVSITALLTLLIAGFIVADQTNPVQWMTLAIAIATLGILGKPADRPLINRAVVPSMVEKLTSDIVIRSLTVLGIAGINQAIAKNPKDAIRFVAPITRDGPGWRADIDLPYGVTVADVMDKRDRMASALRRPLGCIWPEGDSTIHEGRLILWVERRTCPRRSSSPRCSRPARTTSSRASRSAATREAAPSYVPVVQQNILIGSQPGQGKTASVRVLASGAALDPSAELWIHELKGTGDLDPHEQNCHRYVSGIEDEAIGYAADSLMLLRKQVIAAPPPSRPCLRTCARTRRSPGRSPTNALWDCTRWSPSSTNARTCSPTPSTATRRAMTPRFIIKLGRALGVILVLATQRPDKDSLPTGISANVTIRFCLRVAGQLENDMILGTSAYKNGIRATVFQPKVDAGIGYLLGATPMPKVVRTAYLDTPATQRIADRAHALRASTGALGGHALGEKPEQHAPTFDLLADILAVVPLSEAKVWNEAVVDRLAELRPDIYGPWARLEGGAKTAQLTTALKPYGIKTMQVWSTPKAAARARTASA